MAYLHGSSGKGKQLYQDYLQLCMKRKQVLSSEEVRASGLEPNDLAYYYGSFAVVMQEAERDLKMRTEGAKMLKKPVQVQAFSTPSPEKQAKQREERRRKRAQQVARREQHLARYGDTKSNREDARWQKREERVTRSEVMDYMRGLLKEYPNATQPDARSYSVLVGSRIFPKTVKTVLGTEDWDEVLRLCRKKRIGTAKKMDLSEKQEVDEMKNATDVVVAEEPKQRGRPKGSKNKAKEQKAVAKKRKIAAKEEPAVAKKKPGRPKRVEEAKVKKVVKATKAKKAKAQKAPKVAKKTPRSKVVAMTMELKVTMPGMPAPIILEFAVK